MFDAFESTVGERIRYYRKRAGMTQKRLAEACGITEPAIRNYELDNRIPSYETLDDIADALHVNYYTLADPNLGGLIGVMHCFFRIEYVHGLRPVELEGKTALILDPSYNHIDTSILQPFLNRWLQARKKLDSGEWTLEQYEDWQITFPIASPTEKHETAESTDGSSEEMIKPVKHKRPRKHKKQKAE